MHSRLTEFLENNNIIYHLQFGFKKNYFTTHALIHLTNLASESLDKWKFVCGIFVDLQKALTLLIMKFYLVNLTIMVYEVLLINRLKLIHVTEKSMCPLIALNHRDNYDLKNLSNRLNVNKIMLNVTNTELVIFKAKRLA